MNNEKLQSMVAFVTGSEQGGGVLIWLLICFGVLVFVVQAVPALVTFSSMLRGLFSKAPDADISLSAVKSGDDVK